MSAASPSACLASRPRSARLRECFYYTSRKRIAQSRSYMLSVSDTDGRVGIDYGVYGVPETYLIDKDGVIRFKRIGPVTPEVVNKTILPMVKDLNR